MRSTSTGSRCWISSATPGATRRWSVPSRRSPRRKVSFSGTAPCASASPMMAGHCATSCASAKPRLPRTAPAIFGTSAASARIRPRRSVVTVFAPGMAWASRVMVGAFRSAVMPRALRPKIAADDTALAVAPVALARELLAWYDRHRRDLPWRAKRGARSDPYRVWLSEIMLQQTTVATVGPHFQRFLARWPDLAALAAASLDDVLHAWQGLGYYARARHLHACARRVMEGHGGRFPASEGELRQLPGIGDYTAAAVAAIAFDERTTPVDGNVERVMARLFAHEAPLPGAKPAMRALAA